MTAAAGRGYPQGSGYNPGSVGGSAVRPPSTRERRRLFGPGATRREDAMIEVGDRLPGLQLPRLDGENLDFGSLRGKKLLLFMWGSW